MVYNWQDWISRLVLSSFKRICIFFNLVTFALKKKNPSIPSCFCLLTVPHPVPIPDQIHWSTSPCKINEDIIWQETIQQGKPGILLSVEGLFLENAHLRLDKPIHTHRRPTHLLSHLTTPAWQILVERGRARVWGEQQRHSRQHAHMLNYISHPVTAALGNRPSGRNTNRMPHWCSHTRCTKSVSVSLACTFRDEIKAHTIWTGCSLWLQASCVMWPHHKASRVQW